MNKDDIYQIIDNPLLSQRLFFPYKEELNGAFYVDCGDYQLACYQEINFPNAKTLVHFHGNGEIVADHIPDFCEIIKSLGLNLFLVEYPGYGGSSGTPSMSKLLECVSYVFSALNQPQEKLIVFGRSLGSIPAIHFAYSYPSIAGLIIESGISNVLERVLIRVTVKDLNTSEDFLRSVISEVFDHKRKLSTFKNPALIMHTVQDALVNVYHAKDNYQACGGAKELILFEDGDHNTISSSNWPRYIRSLKNFVDKL